MGLSLYLLFLSLIAIALLIIGLIKKKRYILYLSAILFVGIIGIILLLSEALSTM